MEIRKTPFQKATIFWVFAHPDDETICAGRSLIQHRQHNNIVVIMTDGGASGAFRRLNLSKAAFIKARQDECLAAVSHAGVDKVYFAGFPDGQLTKDNVASTLINLISENPSKEVRVKCHTAREEPSHRDHAAVALGVDILYRAGIVTDLREYGISQFSNGAIAAPHMRPIMQNLDTQMKRTMVLEYFLVDPAKGRYGIGGMSVPDILHNSTSMPEAILKPS